MLLHHLGFGDPRSTDIYVNNKATITMGLHPSNKPATRHVDMRVHQLCQHVELGHVSDSFHSLLSDLRPWVVRISRLLCFISDTS